MHSNSLKFIAIFTGKVLREHTFRVRFREEVNGIPLRNLSTELHEMFEEVIRWGSQDYPGGRGGSYVHRCRKLE